MRRKDLYIKFKVLETLGRHTIIETDETVEKVQEEYLQRLKVLMPDSYFVNKPTRDNIDMAGFVLAMEDKSLLKWAEVSKRAVRFTIRPASRLYVVNETFNLVEGETYECYVEIYYFFCEKENVTGVVFKL